MADGSEATLANALRAALSAASKQGVTKLVLSCSLIGGYDEDGARTRWTCIAQRGAEGRQFASVKHFTCEDAIVAALQELGVVF